MTVKHLLIECNGVSDTRNRFFYAQSMKTLFENVSPEKIIMFLKEIDLYSKI